jgi:hypothetical protein
MGITLLHGHQVNNRKDGRLFLRHDLFEGKDGNVCVDGSSKRVGDGGSRRDMVSAALFDYSGQYSTWKSNSARRSRQRASRPWASERFMIQRNA